MKKTRCIELMLSLWKKKPCGSSEGTTSDSPIVGTLPAPKQHNIFIIAITRWSFKYLKMYFIKNEDLQRRSTYQKQAYVCEKSSTNNQQDKRPGRPEPKANPENNNNPV